MRAHLSDLDVYLKLLFMRLYRSSGLKQRGLAALSKLFHAKSALPRVRSQLRNDEHLGFNFMSVFGGSNMITSSPDPASIFDPASLEHFQQRTRLEGFY
jgi:hypothetical protein